MDSERRKAGTKGPHGHPGKVRKGIVVAATIAVLGLMALAATAGAVLLNKPISTGIGDLEAPTEAEAKVIGPVGAPITMVEFSDFQCPFCGQFARKTKAEFVAKYVATGQVRFEYKHFPILGQESLWAAHASQCAAEQGRFWEYHDKVFNSQQGENRGAFSKDNLKRFALDIAIPDGGAFEVCMDSGRYLELIKSEYEEGKRLGVRATPTFFLNGTKVEGAQPLSAFQAVIEKELAK